MEDAQDSNRAKSRGIVNSVRDISYNGGTGLGPDYGSAGIRAAMENQNSFGQRKEPL